MARVTDRITPEGERFFKEIEKLVKLTVRVGYQQGAAQEDDGTDTLDVAMWNELGTSRAPSRPFMRQSVDNNEKKINDFLRLQLQRLAEGKTTAEDIYTQIGVFQKGLIQQTIRDGDFVPNAPSTILRKGSDKPLIDTGKMRQSVAFVIKEKEGSK